MARTLSFLWLVFIFSVGNAQHLPAFIPYRSASGYGYSDSNGRLLITPQWLKADFFRSDNTAIVEASDNGFKTKALINTKGAYIVSPEKHWTGGHFNILDGLNTVNPNGTSGYVNNKGNFTIPPLYTQNGRFTYDSTFDFFYLRTSRGFMYGALDTHGRAIIPFIHKALIYANESQTSLKRYVIAKTDKACCLLAINGDTLIPTGKYDDIAFIREKWLKVTKNGLSGLLDADLRMAIPCNYHLSDFVTDSLISTVTVAQNKFYFGLMDIKGRIILQPKYASVNVINDTLIVASIYKRDKQLYGVVDDRGRKIFPFKYQMIYSKLGDNWLDFTKYKCALRTSNDKPSVDTHKFIATYAYTQRLNIYEPKLRRNEWELTDIHAPYVGPICGNTSEDRMLWEEEGVPSKAFLTVRGKTDTLFTSGDTTWNTITDIGARNISVKVVALHGRPAYNNIFAIVNNDGAFLTRCVTDTELLHYNPVEKIYYAKVHYDYQYIILDSNLVPLIPVQPKSIYKGFHWKGNFYAMVWQQGFGLKNEADYSGNWGPNHHSKYKTLINTVGDTVQIGNYKLIAAVNKSGIRLFQLPFEGIFLVEDTLGKEGFITFNGNIHYPKISFKYDHLKSVGNGYFIASNEQDKYAKLIDQRNRDLLPGAQIVKYRMGEAITSREKDMRVISLFIEQTNGQQSWVYYTYNGILHCDSSCYTPSTKSAAINKTTKPTP